MKLIKVVGARPQFVKVAPVLRATEQHNRAYPRRVSREVLSLPIFPELTEEEMRVVSEAVVEFMERVKV